ncbi:VOC family protein [Erwinia pyri]|nr:VOC family protein [Erwinia sp. DE2]
MYDNSYHYLFSMSDCAALRGFFQAGFYSYPESDCNILLARASNERQKGFIGNQCGGRVFLFLQTDDFWRDYNAMKAKGVEFVQEPREEEYGTVVVFEDLYGNRWDLYQNK